MEIQQSPEYARYIKSMGWTVEGFGEANIFYRHFPIVGTLVKFQRPQQLVNQKKFMDFLKKHHARTVSVEPDAGVSQIHLDNFLSPVREAGFRIHRDPFLPTKTIRVDINRSEEEIFAKFSEAKRRGVRRAQKNGIIVRETDDIRTLIKVKNRAAGFLGFITTTGVDKIWKQFHPDHATGLLGFDPHKPDDPLGSTMILISEKTAYYWIAGYTKKAKKLFIPTLIVWEALKIAKREKCKWFDFIGVWDERFPKLNRQWLGFTKFKEGFGGETLYYPVAK